MSWIHGGIWLYTIAIWVFTVLFIVHCLRSRDLYRPMQWPLNIVKLFWILFLLTFSPFSLLAYFLFAILLRPQTKRSNTANAFYAIAITVLFVFSIPWIQFSFRSLTPNEEYTRVGSDWVEESPSVELDSSLHVGTIESNNNTSTGTSSSSSSDSLFACRRVALIVDDSHPLNQEILEPIVESLKTLSFVEEIKTLSWTNVAQLKGHLPDLFIRISAPAIEENYFPPRLSLSAQYQIHVSDQLFHGHTHYSGNTILPRFQLHMNIHLDHQSTTTFVGTPNSRYAFAAKDIGKNLAETIGKTLREQAEKFPLLTQEADPFILQSTQDTSWPFPSLNEYEPLLTGARPFVSRIAYWKIEDPSKQTQAIEGLLRDVQPAGWYVQEGTDTQKKPRFWRFTKEGDSLEILEEPSRHLGIGTETEPDIVKPLYIVYTEEISREKVIDVLNQKTIDNWPLSLLLALKQAIQSDPDLKDRFFQRLKSEKTTSASHYLVLADMWQSMNDLPQEWLNLNKALILSSVKPDSNSDESSIQERIKKFQEKHPDFQSEYTQEAIYESMDFLPIPSDETWEVTQEVSLDQPVLLWRPFDYGELHTLSIWMTHEPENNVSPTFTLHVRSKNKTGSSESATGGADAWNSSNTFNEDTYNVESQLIGDKRFQITVRKQKNPS